MGNLACMPDEYESVSVETADHVATVTLIGPGKGNAMGPAFWAELPEVFEHPQVVHRGMKISMDGMPMVATPMRFDGERPVADQPPPRLDQHGEAIRAALASGQGWPAR